MITAIKIIFMMAIIFALSYPFIPLKGKMRRYSVSSNLRYRQPHMRKNIFFVLLSVAEFTVVLLIFKIFDKLTQTVVSIPFLGKLLSKAASSLNSQVDYILLAIKLIIINLLMIYVFILLKAFLKKAVLNPLFHIGKREKRFRFRDLFRRKSKAEKAEKKANKTKKKVKDGEESENDDDSESTEEEDEQVRKRRRIPDFVHTMFEDDQEETDPKSAGDGKDPNEVEFHYGPFASRILSIFFEGENFKYARIWVIRTRMMLQGFVYLVEALYLILITVMLSSVFFALPMPLYNLLINILHVGDWYIYPAISIFFLQEICNVFDAPGLEEKIEDPKVEEEVKEDANRESRARALLAELKKRFDSEHSLRYYPEVAQKNTNEYKCTNRAYASALEYIGQRMEKTSGRIAYGYMECLDAIYSDMHVYFPASFYSEFGEYLIAYTYIRLLSGARMIFVVSDPDEKETLRTYINDRLMNMTGSSPMATWRVYTAEERLDQADVLIVTPEEFMNDNIVDQYPAFFEEACNAVFIDADKMVSLDSYICPIIASRLKKATEGRIRFVFLSLDLLKGFAARNLPKFFCIDKVLSFTSAEENEAVSYVLWNRESKKRRIYNKSGQKLTSIETIIAEQAFKYGMDGVRLITESPLEHTDIKVLTLHNVEVNKLYKELVDVNYMIYSDDRCNLSAALYACTRFRGRKKSIVHILSKPYLLREYFMSKANTEDYINRASFIQPRVTEHVENHKLSLLRVFCDVTSEDGMSVVEFVSRMKNIIATQKERGENISSVYCRETVNSRDVESLKLSELAAYLISGLCDNDPFEVKEGEKRAYLLKSLANRAKDFYLVIDPARQDNYSLLHEKKIVFNRTAEVFERLFASIKRVELRLNGETIGLLETFPSRVHLEYIKGQSIIYKNSEYEIEHIAEDGSAIYLRHENISMKNCLDTVLLRNYEIESLKETGNNGLLNNSQSNLEEIRVSLCKADFVGSTYGFYSLTTDRQTLDFYRGVEGNPHSDTPNVRHIKHGNVLRVSLQARIECTDGMRRLLAAVFNEFIRTIFPKAYKCIAICPILSRSDVESGAMEDTPLNRIKTLYPFIKNPQGEFIETDSKRMQFLFINDCPEEIGALEWFFDPSGRYMQEFLANVYSYLHWLKLRPEKAHFIYFGGTSLPECYDLEGCCELLKDFNLILSDSGKKDFETAGDDQTNEKIEYCSFCHKPMESGRFSFFDKHRFICADCFETVDEQSQLDELYISTREYLSKKYPEIQFGTLKPKFDPVYDLTLDFILSEYYYRMDFAERTIYVEVDNPINNVRVSLLRGMIAQWQSDKGLLNQYSSAQLYYEELVYLRSIGEDASADWIYNALNGDTRAIVDQISEYVKGAVKSSDEDGDSATETADNTNRTSFAFMIEKSAEFDTDDDDDRNDMFDDEESSDDLYDPNKVPRFWKRYLLGGHIDDGQEEDVSDAENGEEDEEEEELTVNSAIFDIPPQPNCPPPGADGDDSSAADEKKLKKEEKKRQREERRRQKQLEWEKRMDALDAEEEKKRKELYGDESEKSEKKKRGLFGKKKQDETEKTEDSKDTEDAEDTNDTEVADVEDVVDDTEDLSDTEDTTDIEDTADGEDTTDTEDTDDDGKSEEKPKKKKESKKKDKKKKLGFGGKKLSPGEKILPHEEEEKTNPKVRLYNDLVRAAYNYSEEPISREGLSDEEVRRIFLYVKHDYPEIFWVYWYAYASTSAFIRHDFRCKDANGRLDIKQINQKRAQIKKGAKYFTKGITRKTDPYEALLKIYRRLILTLDYDTAGLNSGTGKDRSKDDVLRSLYGAFVEHKVVCAGYAVAMQYLLQSVGIVCGYVVSEDDASGSCHAFNIVKIGKYCYYLDATWGDYSSTTTDGYKDTVFYDYFCTPYREFIKAPSASVHDHIPRREYYPTFEQFNYTNHEYFRYHNAYLKSYDEREIIRIFADTALNYDADDMGRFMVAMRCADTSLAEHVNNTLTSKGKIFEIIEKAKAIVIKKNKKAAKLLNVNKYSYSVHEEQGTLYYYL